MFVPRPPARRTTTPSRRHLVMTPAATLEAEECRAFIARLQLLLPTPYVENLIIRFQERLRHLTMYDASLVPTSVRRHLMHKWQTLDSAYQAVGGSLADFEETFRMEPLEVQEMLRCDILPEFIRIEGCGKVARCEALLCTLARTGSSSWTQRNLGRDMGRSTAFVCRVVKATWAQLVEDHRWLLERGTLHRFSAATIAEWKRALVEKYRSVIQNPDAPVPEQLQQVAFILDGVRFKIRRPCARQGEVEEEEDEEAAAAEPLIDVQRAFYSRKSGHNLLGLAGVAPNGLIAFMPSLVAGRHQDNYIVNVSQLNDHLAGVNAKALGDALFGQRSHINHIPGAAERQLLNIPVDLCRKLSKIRITVEWGIGLVKETFPLIADPRKLKVFGTDPVTAIDAAVLLTNFKICMRGNIITSYIGCCPPTLVSYMAGYGKDE